ncbi:MAG: hypothetical protein WKG07_18735 [Hymenobacter sp.]
MGLLLFMIEFDLRRLAIFRLGWLVVILLGINSLAQAQIERPVTWAFAASAGRGGRGDPHRHSHHRGQLAHLLAIH